MKVFLLASGAVFLLAAAVAYGATRPAPAPLPTVSHVDLHRYAGQWYEIARLPNFFQRAGESATAEYLPLADGGVRVINNAYRPDGRSRSIRGEAHPVSGTANSRLRVRFDGFASLVPVSAEGNYWIIALDPVHYRYAMVGTPDRKFLWLLARAPHLDQKTADHLRSEAQKLGFATAQLYWDQR